MKRKYRDALAIAKDTARGAGLGCGLAEDERLVFGGQREADRWIIDLVLVSLTGVKGLEADANAPGRLMAQVVVVDDQSIGQLVVLHDGLRPTDESTSDLTCSEVGGARVR